MCNYVYKNSESKCVCGCFMFWHETEEDRLKMPFKKAFSDTNIILLQSSTLTIPEIVKIYVGTSFKVAA